MRIEPRAAQDFGNVVAERELAQLAGFTHTLRDNGFTVGLKETEDAARLMCSHIASRPALLCSAFKSLFCARRSDWLKFDGLFDAYWLGRGRRCVVELPADQTPVKNSEVRGLVGSGSEPGQETWLGRQVPCGMDGHQEFGTHSQMEGASRAERLAATDFRKIADRDAMAEAHALAERLARRMRTRLSRRERARLKGRRIDLRRTIRRNISHGGVPIELLLRQKKTRPLRVVILLDASGSMSLSTSIFVRFIHGVLDHFREAEAFLFHTRLVHVSPAMREKDVGRALERLSLLAQGVGGGTRIGESLATFNRWYAASVIHSRTCV